MPYSILVVNSKGHMIEIEGFDTEFQAEGASEDLKGQLKKNAVAVNTAIIKKLRDKAHIR